MGRLIAGAFLTQVQLPVVGLPEQLEPFGEGLDVHCPYLALALAQEIGHQMAADEPAGTRHHYQIVLVHDVCAFPARAPPPQARNIVIGQSKIRSYSAAWRMTVSKRVPMASISKVLVA